MSYSDAPPPARLAVRSAQQQLAFADYPASAASTSDAVTIAPVTSQLWFILLVSFSAAFLLGLLIFMSYCVYRRQAAKQRHSFVDNAEPPVSYGSLAIDSSAADGSQMQPASSSLVNYPEMHVQVSVSRQVQSSEQQNVVDAALHESTACLQVSDTAECEQQPEVEQPVVTLRPLERRLTTVPSGTELCNSSGVSCSSTPSAVHRACSPTQSLPASSSSSSGLPHSSSSSNRRSRLKGLLESRRGSSASLTISLTPTSSTALTSTAADELNGNQTHSNACGNTAVDCKPSAALSNSTSSSERGTLESIAAAKSRSPLTLANLTVLMQPDNVSAVHDEFWSLPMNHFQKVTVPGASIKNRYRTILPNEHSRVTLQPPFQQRTGSLSSPSASAQSPNNNGCNAQDSESSSVLALGVDPLCIYINANYVRAYVPSVDRANRAAQALASRAFIATQGPLPNTVVDFWRMCWTERSPCVVMITRLMEKSKIKCEAYLPPFNGAPSLNASANGCTGTSTSSSSTTTAASPTTATVTVASAGGLTPSCTPPAAIVTQSYGDVQVAVLSLQIKDGYEVRDVLLRCDNETHAVKHYWFTAWPDNKTPSTAKQLIQMILEIRAHRDKQAAILQQIRQRHGSPSCEAFSSGSAAASEQQLVLLGPTVVHCSAGLGRTGCFIAICNAMQQFEAEQAVDILGIVAQMRLDRGGLIQTNEQYEFVYRAICEYAGTFSAKSLAGSQS